MAISKKTRFEVFKRDKFTCQYCGQSSPDVILHIDHIHPISEGGEDDLLNLVTSCRDCNLGKSNRLLSDDAAIKRRKSQLDELQERREQLELLMEWHKSLIDLEQIAVEELADLWDKLIAGYSLNDSGLGYLKRWLSKFTVDEIAECMRISTSQYLDYAEDPNKPTHESVEKAYKYVPKIITSRRRMKDKPYLSDLYYIRGILRNRLSYINEWKSIQLMESAYQAGCSIDEIKQCALAVRSWTCFRETMEAWSQGEAS